MVECPESSCSSDGDGLRMPLSFVLSMVSDKVAKLREIQKELLDGGDGIALECPNGHEVHFQCPMGCEPDGLRVTCPVHFRTNVLYCEHLCTRESGRCMNLQKLSQHRQFYKAGTALALASCWDMKKDSGHKKLLLECFPALKTGFKEFENGARAILDLASANHALTVEFTLPKEGCQTIPRIILEGGKVLHGGEVVKI